MNSLMKYILSLLLIVGAVHMLFSVDETDDLDEFEMSYVGKIQVPFTLVDAHTRREFWENDKITPLILLNTRVCTPCLNNVADYAEIFSKDEKYGIPLLVFLDEDENQINRFVVTTGLDLKTLRLNSRHVAPFFKETIEQNLLFWDREREILFYNEPIPNATTTLVSKEQLVEYVYREWNNRIAGPPNQ